MPLDCSCTSMFSTIFYLCEKILCMILCFELVFDAMVEFRDV